MDEYEVYFHGDGDIHVESHSFDLRPQLGEKLRFESGGVEWEVFDIVHFGQDIELHVK